MRATRKLAPAITALAFAACSSTPDLDPAPAAQPAAGPGESFVASENGVRVTAGIEAWQGNPADLEERVTPVLVTVTNAGSQPLRLSYDLFELEQEIGRDYPALPPFRIAGEVIRPVDAMVFTPQGFYIAPHLTPFYPELQEFDQPFDYDPAYYDLFDEFELVQLPTADMVSSALPEGVLMPGGEVSGFLYFRRVTDEATSVDLTLALETPAGTGFGTIAIPFLVKR